MKVRFHARAVVALGSLAVVVALAGCGSKHAEDTKELAYVAAPQVMLRDRVAAVYNKVGTAKNGEKLVVLDKQKRFVKVRTERNEEGWVEQRYLADPQIYAAASRLANTNLRAPSQGKATTRNDTNLHVEPGREADHLYLLKEGDKVDVLARATAEKPGTKITPKDPNDKVPPPVMEDWRMVRDGDGHVGWVLSRMLDLDVPIDVAQYAEGQRIVGYYKLNEVAGSDGKKVGQFMLAVSEPKDGLPFDYDQVRVFTWNPKRDHYETAYRERNLQGVLPITVGLEGFGKDGKLPVFVLRVRGEDDKITERKYKMNGVMVRRVLAPGEEAPPTRPAAGKRRHRQ
jgi:SH3-like domain-containing protein